MVSFPKICLASQSPRRRELLEQLGVKFDVLPANIDETPQINESPESYVKRITCDKARAIWQSPDFEQNRPVLASDTAVIFEQSILGKPTGEVDGKQMLRLLSGADHWVITGVVMLFNDIEQLLVSRSKVTFKPLSKSDIDAYWKTGEGSDKAGSYAIQGMAASFVERIEGSFSGVMGLPLFETTQLLEQFNVEFWKANINE